MIQPRHRWVFSWMRHPVLGVVFILGMATAILSFGRAFAGDKPNQPTTTGVHVNSKEAKSERPAFDLTYLPPNAMGVIALRPHAIFDDPAMKPLAAMANKSLEQLLHFLNLAADPKLRVEDIEQIIGNVTIKPGDKKHGRNHSLVAGLTMIRTTRDFDWMKVMRQIDPKIEEVRHEGCVYYRCHFPKLIACISPKAALCFCIPDKRSIAFLEGKALTAFLKERTTQQPHFTWDKDWQHIERGLLAVAMDTRWANGLSKEQLGDDHNLVFLFQDSVTMIAGVDWKDGLDFHAYLIGKDRAASQRLVKGIKAMLAQWPRNPEQAPEDEEKAAAFNLQMYQTLLEHMRVQQQDTEVCVRTAAKMNVADFVKYCFQECTISPK